MSKYWPAKKFALFQALELPKLQIELIKTYWSGGKMHPNVGQVPNLWKVWPAAISMSEIVAIARVNIHIAQISRSLMVVVWYLSQASPEQSLVRESVIRQ